MEAVSISPSPLPPSETLQRDSKKHRQHGKERKKDRKEKKSKKEKKEKKGRREKKHKKEHKARHRDEGPSEKISDRKLSEKLREVDSLSSLLGK